MPHQAASFASSAVCCDRGKTSCTGSNATHQQPDLRGKEWSWRWAVPAWEDHAVGFSY